MNQSVATKDTNSDLQRASIRASIHDLERHLIEECGSISPEEAEAQFVTHHFAPGTYARWMTIEKGMCIVGKIHQHAHLNILISGKVQVTTEHGDDYIEGPKMWTSEPGTKRALIALTDLIWVTIHTDPFGDGDTKALEKHIIAPSYDALEDQS